MYTFNHNGQKEIMFEMQKPKEEFNNAYAEGKKKFKLY